MRRHIYLEITDNSLIELLREELGKSINCIGIHDTKEGVIEQLESEE